MFHEHLLDMVTVTETYMSSEEMAQDILPVCIFVGASMLSCLYQEDIRRRAVEQMSVVADTSLVPYSYSRFITAVGLP